MLNLQLYPLSILLAISACLTAWLFGFSWPRRQQPGVLFFSLLMLAVTYWSLTYAIEFIVPNLASKVLWAKLQYAGIVSLPPLWFLFSLAFSQRAAFMFRSRMLLLWSVPALVFFLVLTNEYHHLIWRAVSTVDEPHGLMAVYAHGPVFYIYTVYAYLLMLFGVATLLFTALRSSILYRQQVVFLVLGAITPVAANLMYVLHLEPFSVLDPTPFAFTISGVLFMLSIFHLRLWDLVPVAYDQVFASIGVGVVVVDEHNRIVDMNPAAHKFLQTTPACLYKTTLEAFEGRLELQVLFQTAQETHIEFVASPTGRPQWFDIQVSMLTDLRSNPKGRLFSIKDITKRKQAEEMARADASFIRMLNKITHVALSAPDLREALNLLAVRMGELIDADACYITLWDAQRRLTIPAAAYGLQHEEYLQQRFSRSQQPFTEAIMQARHTLVVDDVMNSPYIGSSVASFFKINSVIGLPIISDGVPLGAVIIGFESQHIFSEVEILRCEQAAQQVSLTIAKMKLLDEERQRAEELDILNRIGIVLTAGLNMESLLRSIFVQCRRVIEIDTFYLALYDATTGQISFPIFYDRQAYHQIESHDIHTQPGLTGYIIESRKALFIGDMLDPELVLPYPPVKSGADQPLTFIGVPMIWKEKVLGVISVQSNTPYAYTLHHQRLLETIATQSSIAIENARLYAEVKRLSTIDDLTQLYNYRGLFELGPRELDRARRFARTLTVLFIDIDDFRDFNNRYSHATGNKVLQEVANALRANMRTVDLLARYGGDEFVILLPETTLPEALQISERLCQSVSNLRLQTEWGVLAVTISIGAAGFDATTVDLQTLIDLANAAERRAKMEGRNRVETYS